MLDLTEILIERLQVVEAGVSRSIYCSLERVSVKARGSNAVRSGHLRA